MDTTSSPKAMVHRPAPVRWNVTGRAPVDDVLAAPGEALDTATRNAMEGRFGWSFAQIRVHADDRAERAARAVGARAFSVGQEVVFARGEYAPHTTWGRSLLIHELAHTIQQRNASTNGALGVSSPGEAVERQADDAGAAISAGQSPGLLATSGPVIARQSDPKGGDVKSDPPVDKYAGAQVTHVIVSLARNRVGFLTDRGKIFGTISTDLRPGSYELRAETAKKKWVIVKPVVRTGFRFLVDLEGALPWTLSYSKNVPLTVAVGMLTEPKTWDVDPAGQPLDPLWLHEGMPPLPAPKGIDDFESINYDIDYRSEKSGLSKWLIVYYSDGSRRDINIDSIGSDTPRLFAAKGEVLKVMDDYNTLWILGTFSTVFFVITINPFVAPVGGGPPVYSATRRTVSKTSGSVVSRPSTAVSTARRAAAPSRTSAAGSESSAAAKTSATGKTRQPTAKKGAVEGPVGPLGRRPPGSPSRYSDEEIAKEYLREIGKKVPVGERAAEELGVTARALRKVEENHHLLVQQLRRWFRSRGINIDKYTVKLSADEHRWIHNEYRWNDLWKDFKKSNPTATPEEIMAAMRKFMKQAGLEGLDIVPYPR